MSSLLIEFTASVLVWLMLGGVFLLWILDGKKKKEIALHVILSLVLSWVLSNIIKELVFIPRPFHIKELPVFVIIPPWDGAFPSAHSAIAFSMAVTVWLHNKKWGIIYLIFALLIGISRVIANVHYPIDIVGGALLGVTIAFAIEKWHLFKLLNP